MSSKRMGLSLLLPLLFCRLGTIDAGVSASPSDPPLTEKMSLDDSTIRSSIETIWLTEFTRSATSANDSASSGLLGRDVSMFSKSDGWDPQTAFGSCRVPPSISRWSWNVTDEGY